jgi:hypothetical protein
MSTATTDLFVNSHLFTPERAPYPDEDLAVCVQTPRAFSANMAAEGLERAERNCRAVGAAHAV